MKTTVSRRLIATALLRLAKCVLSYTPIRDKETEARNQSWHDMVTAYVPKLHAAATKAAQDALDGDGYDVVKASQVKSDYLHYRDPEHNSNKYHYYALLDCRCDDGVDRYVAVNAYGRVGFIEKVQILGKRAFDDRAAAEREYDRHYGAKVRKGYQPIRLKRG